VTANPIDPFAKIANFEPKATPQSAPTTAAVKDVAAQHGFTAPSNPPPQRRYFRKPGGDGVPMVSATMRVTLEDWNAFQAFCEENHYTARNGFGELVKLLSKRQ
jgi:hypothetical protein